MAYEEALKYGGSVILGDRPVQVIFLAFSQYCYAAYNMESHSLT